MNTAIGTPEVTTGRAGRTPPARGGRLIATTLVAVVVGVAGVRFVTAGHHDARPETGAGRPGVATPAVAAQTSAQRIAALQARVNSSPDDGPSWLSLASEATRAAVRSSDPVDYDLATRAVGQARRLLPADARVAVVDGVLALSLHDFVRAATLGTEAHAANPTDDEALGVLVDASVELGRYDEAAAHLDGMLARRPGSAALARVSYLRELHGDLPGARLAMTQALTAAGSTADRQATATFLTELDLAAGDLGGARRNLDLARAIDPDRVATALVAARVQAAEGDLPGAIIALEPVLARSAQPAVANLLGELQLRAGRTTAAADSFALVRANQRLLTAAGVRTDLEAAQFEADHGRPADAVTLARSAYAYRQTVLTADALGWALTRSGDATAALPFVEESIALGTRSVSVRLHAALAFDGAGRPDDARAQLTMALDGNPWMAPSLIDDARALADRLGIELPAPWRIS